MVRTLENNYFLVGTKLTVSEKTYSFRKSKPFKTGLTDDSKCKHTILCYD